MLGQETVSVTVGETAKTFRLHKDLLCRRSKYFDAAFNRGFKESETYELKLPEEDEAAFGLFVDWLYRGSLPELAAAPELYIKVYEMAEKWLIVPLQNQVCDRLRDFPFSAFKPLDQFIQFLYATTSAGCNVRMYLHQKIVRVVSLDSAHAAEMGTALESNPEFATDIAKYTLFVEQTLTGYHSRYVFDPDSKAPEKYHIKEPEVANEEPEPPSRPSKRAKR